MADIGALMVGTFGRFLAPLLVFWFCLLVLSFGSVEYLGCNIEKFTEHIEL